MSPAVDRIRVLLSAVAWPLLTGYVLIVALLAVVNALAPQAQFSVPGVLLAAWPGWLAAYQVPLTIAGQPLGVLPLVSTGVVCYLVARSAGDAAQRLDHREPQQAVVVIGVMAGVHALLGVTIAVLANGTEVTVEPLAAFILPALFGGLAATAGVARRCRLLDLGRKYVDDAAVHGLRAAAFGMAGLLAIGSVVFAASSLLSAPTMHELFVANAPGFGSGLGMLLLSLLYLPNAVVGALSFTIGPGVSFGSASMSPFGFSGGTVPGVPLLAGMPESYHAWWPVLLVLPVGVGLAVGWTCRQVDPMPLARLRVIAVAGAIIGFACVLLGTFAGGQLGTGPFRAVVIPVGLFSLAAFCLVAVPAGLVAWFAGPQQEESQPEKAQPAEAQQEESQPEEEGAAGEEPAGGDTDSDIDSSADSGEETAPDDDGVEEASEGDEAEAEESEDSGAAPETEDEVAEEPGEESDDAPAESADDTPAKDGDTEDETSESELQRIADER